MLEVRLLGSFQIKSAKKTVSLASRPAQSLFAFLVLNAGTSYRREKLAGQLWPESTEESARDYLRHALWRIRKALQNESSAAYLKADDLTISFDASVDHWLDAAAIKQVSEEAPADELIAVLSEYAGELLPGFYDEWLVLERQQLQGVYERKVECLLASLQEAGRWDDVLKWAEKWIALGQKPEAAYRYLMSAQAAKGDLSKVVAAYDRCLKSMREYGVEPSEQTSLLYASLKSGTQLPKAADRGKRSEAQRPDSPSANIPVPLTSFIGRDQELKHISKLLSDSRLLTLTGPGGVGKTRLAIQAASNSIKTFKDGVYWVGLVGLSDEALFPQEIAHSLQIREVAQEPVIETLKSQLRSRELLIVLDNCEHLIRVSAQVAEQLLGACPRLKILATSIEALGLFSEVVWQVPSLPLPDQKLGISVLELKGFASIELFEERASHAKPGFALSDGNASSIAKICYRLDGIPLAIELAAARIKVLSVDEIASRLDDRFSLLTAGSRTAIPRHQTLRATIDWSHELLSEPEKALFRRLAVFVGGFTLEAAEAVCSQSELSANNILDLLGRLVDKSLVIVDASVDATESRYRMLETLRQYALEKLMGAGEAPRIREQHLQFFLRLSEQAEPSIYGRDVALWVRRLDLEVDNIRSTIEWATNSGEADSALRILGALVYYWFARGLVGSEWDDRVHEALQRPEGQARTLARAKALNGVGFMYWADLLPVDRRADLDEALSIGRALGDPWNTATALRNLGLLENIHGNYEAARNVLEQSLAIWRQMGREGEMGLAHALIFLGDVAIKQGDVAAARSLFEESASILRGPGDMNFLAYCQRRLGQLAWWEGNFERARALCDDSLKLNQTVGDPRGELATLAGYAAIAVAQGKNERAAQLMGAVEQLLRVVGLRLLLVDNMEYERNLERLRKSMTAKTLEKWWAKGSRMSLDDAIAFAVEEA